MEDLGQYFRFDGPAESYVEREEFDEACRELRQAGYRVGDPESAWQAFAKMRGEYAGPLNAMARQWLTPPHNGSATVPWSLTTAVASSIAD